MYRKRIEAPESAISSTQAATKITVSPRLGCFISRIATTPVSTAVSGTTGRLSSLSFIDSTQAMVTMKRGFRNSDGWNRVKPASSQRTAPFRSTPMTGTRNSSRMQIAAPRIESRRAVFCASIETPIITGTASAIQNSWR